MSSSVLNTNLIAVNQPLGGQFEARPVLNGRLRWGRRRLQLCRDFRHRPYRVHPLVECQVGATPGSLEVLLCRKWLIMLSREAN